MKILVLDTEFVGVDFCLRCQRWGHDVLYYQAPGKGGVERKDGNGMIAKVRDFDDLRKRYIGWADLIFLTDNTKYLELLEPFRKIGYPIFGPSPQAAELELNRETGQKAMKDCGIPIIESKTFHDYDAAIRYVKSRGIAMVSKPSGEADKALSYVADNPADLVYMMERWKKNPKYVKSARECGFIVQEKKKGIELAIGGWFGPGGWGKHLTLNAEYKKLHNGDLGVNTGEQGTLVSYVRSEKLFDKILKPMTPLLESLDYVGYIDNNAIIDDSGNCWPMEFTCRPGWPLFDNQMALHEGDPAQWMLDLLTGSDTLKVKERTICVSVVLTIPDYPYSHFTAKEIEGIPVYEATSEEHIHPKQMMVDGDVPCMVGNKVCNMPNYVTSGDYVLVATGCGATITGARRSVYSAIKRVSIPNSPAYRTDIGNGRMVKQLPQLQALGYAKSWSFM